MKLSEAPCKIIGLQVGELTLDLIRSGMPALQVRFAFIAEEIGAIGFMDVRDSHNWSQKTLDAMRAFTDALEEDALRTVFKVDGSTQSQETSKTDETDGPPQF